MLEISQEEKKVLIDFLMQLTVKITYDSPYVAELLLANQSSHSHKEKKYDYLPL